MPRIVHIAIKVDDLEKATKFYEEVFGFRWHGSRNRRSRSLQKENGGGACITGAENTKRPTNSSFFGNLKTAKTGSARSAHRAVIELRNRRWPNRELA
jgi:catechol 2,3-dioxygenase-like lactoylglutathione lyase family enzyme